MNFSKVLVIQEKMIGDVLISTIICHNLKKQFPNAEVHYLVAPNTFPVIQDNPNIDKVIFYDDSNRKNWLNFYRFLKTIKLAKYDLVIDAYGKLDSCLITKFSRAKYRVGYRQKEKISAYNFKIDHHEEVKTNKGLAIERRENLLKAVCKSNNLHLLPKIFLTNDEILQGQKKVVAIQDKIKVMVSLFGSHANKTYPLQYMVKVIDRVAEHPNVEIFFNYMPHQKSAVDAFVEQCKTTTQAKMNVELVGESLRDFMILMHQCDVMIGNDGGATNIAKALGKPTFILFSPWILKESWSIFEDGMKNVGIHLNDYKPNTVTHQNRKKIKKQYEAYYNALKPELFLTQLDQFLRQHGESTQS